MKSDVKSSTDWTSEQTEAARKFMAEFLIGRVTKYISRDDSISITEAMKKLYSTSLPDQLFDFETKLYSEGPGYIYELYKEKSN